MKKNIGFIIRGFDQSLPNDPIYKWRNFALHLAKKKTIRKIFIFCPLTEGREYRYKNITVIPSGNSPIKLYHLVKKSDLAEMYIIGNYLSALIYTLISGRRVRKKIYLMRNRILFQEYRRVMGKYKWRAWGVYYWFSIIKMGALYRLAIKYWKVRYFIFPSKRSRQDFIADTRISPSLCLVLRTQLQKHRFATQVSPLVKGSKERWITYAGSASVFRGVDILAQAFEGMYLQDASLKLVVLLLNPVKTDYIFTLLRRLPKKRYLVKAGRLSDELYSYLLRKSDVFVGPFSFSYGIPERPSTLLEAMHLATPVIVSDIVCDYFFRDRYNCLKFKTMDAQDLQARISELLENKQLRRDIVKNAKISLTDTTYFQDNTEAVINS
ncbi:hypothetical protein A2783_02640 [Microgenomates group bacterium RIFCSPHIGHO2_01_FULL_45_11]|nr:MAG: hypothetical protein A2783_02640 [Microgenomates group bacterium RIFCSPHIGHO2_01_FULL_45_11]